MSFLPRILPNGNVVVPECIEGKGFIGDGFVEIAPGDPDYKAVRAEAERFAKFVELEDEQFAESNDPDAE